MREFYRQLLAEAATALGAAGGAAWLARPGDAPQQVCRSAAVGEEPPSAAMRRQLIEACLATGAARVHGAGSLKAAGASRDGGFDLLVCPVRQPAASAANSGTAAMVAAIELWLPGGANPSVEQGWLDFSTTLAEVAADFHALDELRRLREGAAISRHAAELLRRVQVPRTLAGAAFEAANEGRRLLACDRLSVLVRRGRGWRLVSTSGVDRIGRRTDFTRLTERLADQAARWGEPIIHPDSAGGAGELPPQLAQAIEDHADHSHARSLACVPVAFAPRNAVQEDARGPRRRAAFDAVFVAERFDAAGEPQWQQQLVELAELCAPALGRAAQLDRFPVRTLLGWSEGWAVVTQPRRLVRTLSALAALAAVAAALVYVPADFDVEAPATLVTTVERDIFATATGAVDEVRVGHGQAVAAGDVLVVLSDPELALKLQQTRGELDATRQRLDALAVTRTDRTLRDNASDDRLPLSAEQQQLEQRLATLAGQRQLLEARREALTIRSPLAGQVLTRDVQTLLQSRPVERGQVLLTIADTHSGWQLVADVPQRRLGHVLDAQRDVSDNLRASYRLAGDVDQSYSGTVVAVNATAALDADGLQDDPPPVEVRIAVEGDPPAAARPGMNASVRIHCGQQPLGYVWLHDVGATIYRWATF